MPDSNVNIQFNADPAEVTSAFAKVDGALGELVTEAEGASKALAKVGDAQQFGPVLFRIKELKSEIDSVTRSSKEAGNAMAAWRAETGLAAQPTIGGGGGITSHTVERPAVRGKTAADFAPATAEMRAASIAEEEVGKNLEKVGESAQRAGSGVGAFRGTMRALRFDAFEVVAVLGVLAKAIDEAGKAEASQRHAQNQGISPVSMALLEKNATDERFQPRQYDDAAVSLKVAGIATSDLVKDVKQLGIASRVSGVGFEELTKTAEAMTDEFEDGGVPSLSQMTTLTLASSGATQGLTDKYRELSKELRLNEKEWKVQEQQQARSHQKTEEHTSAVDSFAGRTGIAADAFGAFQRSSYLTGDSVGNTGGILSKQFDEGLKQLQSETEISADGIRNYMAAGKIGYEELISASGRYRAHQQEELEYTQKQRDEQARLSTEAQQRSLGLQALQSVMDPSEWKDQQAALQKATPEGIQQEITAKLTEAMVGLGKVVAEWFPQIKVAMMFLAGVEIASRIAAMNARFFPGGIKLPGGAAGSGEAAAPAEGGASAAGAGFKPPLWLAPLAYGGMTSEQNALSAQMNAKQPEYNKANKAIGNYMGGIWNNLTGGKPTDNSRPDLGAAQAQTPAKNSSDLTKVEDPKMHELIQQLLKVFASSG